MIVGNNPLDCRIYTPPMSPVATRFVNHFVIIQSNCLTMKNLNPYLNFMGNTEAAMNFYKSIFGGEFTAFTRYKDVPGGEKMIDAEKEKIMHASLPVGANVIPW